MISRRFACLLLALAMMLSSIWVVSADQSHQIQDAAEAAAVYAAAVEALEQEGLSGQTAGSGNLMSLAIDLGILEQSQELDLYQLSVQAVQLQRKQELAAQEAAEEAARQGAARTGRQAVRQALLREYDGVLAETKLTIHAKADEASAALRNIETGKVAKLLDLSEDGAWYRVSFGGREGYLSVDRTQPVHYSDYAGTSAVKSTREELVDYAKSFLGTRYVWGGASPSGFDCSGFTMYVYAHFGYRMSHGASEQLYAFTRVSTQERQAGDLVFFSYGGGQISHVGIYLGNGSFIHATSNGGVKISWFDSYFSRCYVGAVRILVD